MRLTQFQIVNYQNSYLTPYVFVLTFLETKTKARKAVFEEQQTSRVNGIGVADPCF